MMEEPEYQHPDFNAPWGPAQGLDAATIERCAAIVEDEKPRNDVSDWTDYARDKNAILTGVADRIRALNTASTATRGEDARLREALEPFAKEADSQELVTSFRDGNCIIPRTRITIGQLRRARAALQGDAAHTSQEKGNG